jgi:sporulation protein YlmC with PRC-barrel domain
MLHCGLPRGPHGGPADRHELGAMMDIEELRGRAVVSVQQAEKLGAIADTLVDVTNHQLAGVLLQGGMFRGGDTVPWTDIRTIGQDAVMVDDRSVTQHDVATDAVRFANLRGRKVVTDAGELVGTIDGADLNQETGNITSYVVAAASTGLFRTAPRYQVPPDAVAAVGDNIITIDAKAIDDQRATT